MTPTVVTEPATMPVTVPLRIDGEYEISLNFYLVTYFDSACCLAAASCGEDDACPIRI